MEKGNAMKGPITCMGSRQLFGPRCGSKATYRSPAGPLCTPCAERAIKAIWEGSTLLNVLAEARGVSIDELVAKYVRIQDDEMN
jgi:hypothetical protein